MTNAQQTGTNGTPSMMQDCIQACSDCHDVCLQTINSCLQQGGHHAEAAHIRLLMDCAMICHTSEDFMLRGSELHARVCGVCAEVCQRCAESCEGMGDDPQMRTCADTCRRCADSCRQMAQA